jgi:hypothetical protein
MMGKLRRRSLSIKWMVCPSRVPLPPNTMAGLSLLERRSSSGNCPGQERATASTAFTKKFGQGLVMASRGWV